MITLVIFVLIMGLISVIFPETGWKLIYGRKLKNTGASPNVAELKIQRILGVIIIIAAAVLFFVLPTGFGAGYYSWYGTNLSRSAKADSWTISANTVNGSGTRNLEFDSVNLSALHVESVNKEGTVLLKLTQGDTKKFINITGGFAAYIDMNDFKPGSIKMSLEFEKVKNLKLKINW